MLTPVRRTSRLGLLLSFVLLPAVAARAQPSDVEASTPAEAPPDPPEIDGAPTDETIAPEATVAEAPPTPRPPPIEGHAVGHRGNDVIIDVGRRNGVVLGSMVMLYVEHPVDLGDGEIATEHEQVASGPIIALTEGRALVELGANESVPIGAAAHLSFEEASASATAPNRIGGVWELRTSASAFAVSNALGGGVLGDASLTYRGVTPFYVRMRIDPSGFTIHRSERGDDFDSSPAGSGMVTAGFDHRYIGFGAGFGVTRVLGGLEGERYCRTCSEPTRVAPRIGFAFGLEARFGTIDGLHLGVEVAFTTVVDHSKISLLTMDLQIPVNQTLAFVVRGGSGFTVTGASFANVGARMRVRGDGLAGSMYVTPYLGFAQLADGVWLDPNDDERDVRGYRRGAAAGTTLEYRF